MSTPVDTKAPSPEAMAAARVHYGGWNLPGRSVMPGARTLAIEFDTFAAAAVERFVERLMGEVARVCPEQVSGTAIPPIVSVTIHREPCPSCDRVRAAIAKAREPDVESPKEPNP